MPVADPLAALDAIPDALLAAAIARLAGRAMQAPRGGDGAPDDLLTVAEAAVLLRMTPRWIWRNARSLGGVRPSPRRLLLSRKKTMRWLDGRRG